MDPWPASVAVATEENIAVQETAGDQRFHLENKGNQPWTEKML